MKAECILCHKKASVARRLPQGPLCASCYRGAAAYAKGAYERDPGFRTMVRQEISRAR